MTEIKECRERVGPLAACLHLMGDCPQFDHVVRYDTPHEHTRAYPHFPVSTYSKRTRFNLLVSARWAKPQHLTSFE